MATKSEKEEKSTVEEERSPLLGVARKVLLAGIGAVALAQEEIEEFVNKLVERGEIAEKDGRKLVQEVKERRKKDAKKAEDELSSRIEDILERMNVPTKSDIDTLSEKISLLSEKVDELKETQA